MEKKKKNQKPSKEILITYKYRMMSEKSNLINMDKASLEKLSKSELINLVLKQQKQFQHQKDQFLHRENR